MPNPNAIISTTVRLALSSFIRGGRLTPSDTPPDLRDGPNDSIDGSGLGQRATLDARVPVGSHGAFCLGSA